MHTQCFAQTRLLAGEVKSNNKTFIVHKIKPMLSDTEKIISVYSKSNKYNNGIPYSKAEKDPRFLPMNQVTDMHVNVDEIKPLVYGVLGDKIRRLKQNKESIEFDLIFKPNGEIVDMTFFLNENTLISAQEIEEIDTQLRNKIKATFTGKQYLNYEAIPYGRMPKIVF